jgi:hypothetical protein
VKHLPLAAVIVAMPEKRKEGVYGWNKKGELCSEQLRQKM